MDANSEKYNLVDFEIARSKRELLLMARQLRRRGMTAEAQKMLQLINEIEHDRSVTDELDHREA